MFFDSFYSEFQKLKEGIQIDVPPLDTNVVVRGILLMGTCDLPAKASCLNYTQFNGEYGCPVCFSKGETLHLPTGGNVHVYPYSKAFDLRTLITCNLHAHSGTIENPQMGVKGPTILSLLMPDFIKGMAIDRMHGVDGGVVKKILSLLFDTKFRTYGFSLINAVNIINTKLTQIKPPKFVHRMPRTVNDLIHWKASELKLWFFIIQFLFFTE